MPRRHGEQPSSRATDLNGRDARTLLVTLTDVTRGRAAEGVLSVLERQVDGNWEVVARGTSDPAGTMLIDPPIPSGLYRIELDVGAYFTIAGTISLLPKSAITFRIPEASGNCQLQIYIATSSQFASLRRTDYPVDPLPAA
jgi:5-hydroxyisourate hydrolase-like protein (transthyretin family)